MAVALRTSPCSSADEMKPSELTPADRAHLLRQDMIALAGELLELTDVVTDDEEQTIRRLILALGGQWWA